jgi:hypothetical protein
MSYDKHPEAQAELGPFPEDMDRWFAVEFPDGYEIIDGDGSYFVWEAFTVHSLMEEPDETHTFGDEGLSHDFQLWHLDREVKFVIAQQNDYGGSVCYIFTNNPRKIRQMFYKFQVELRDYKLDEPHPVATSLGRSKPPPGDLEQPCSDCGAKPGDQCRDDCPSRQ